MMESRLRGTTIHAAKRRDPVEENARFSSILGFVLMILLIIEIATVLLGVRTTLDLHVIAGTMVTALVIPKLMTTGYRLVQYYRGQPAFAGKGPPPIILRVISPVMATAVIGLLASGALIILGPSPLHSAALHVHNFTFYSFLALIVVHTAAHLKEAISHSAADTRRVATLAGRRLRMGTVIGGLVAGAIIGSIVASHVGSYLTTWPHH